MKPILATPECAALQYLDYWYEHDRENSENLQTSATDKQRIAAVENILSAYGIARCFPIGKCADKTEERKKKGDRAKGILKMIDEVAETGKPTPDNVAEKVEGFRNRLRTIAHKKSDENGQNVISAASKLLWHKFKFPVVMYDDNVHAALRELGHSKIGNRNYQKFLKAWKEEYGKHEGDIAKACEAIVEAKVFSRFAVREDNGYLKGIASEEWFRERVFDFMLWLSYPGE